MVTGIWKPISEPPKKNGRYMVMFHFKYRHPTDNLEFAYREFIDGVWKTPYYGFPKDGGELIEWFDEGEEEK